MHIDSLNLIEMPDGDTSRVRGPLRQGHLRARARPRHGRELGCLGHLIALRRTRVAPFDEAAGGEPRGPRSGSASRARTRCTACLLPIEAALQDLAAISVGQNDAARLLRGQAVLIRGRDAPTGSGPTYATCKGQLIAVGRDRQGRVAPAARVQFRRRRLNAR